VNNGITHLVAELVIILPAFMISLSVHEFAHAMAATLLGDSTPGRMGRLTLNPIAHVDPMGLLFLIILRIGWAKPVIFDHRNFKYPRFYSVITAFAGPISNFFFALIVYYMITYCPWALLPDAVSNSFLQILRLTARVNVMLGVFNILPIPPLDGSHLIMALLVNRFPHVVIWLYRYSMFFLIGLFLLPQTRNVLLQLIIFAERIIRGMVI
jgi:Zn-dependent protease